MAEKQATLLLSRIEAAGGVPNADADAMAAAGSIDLAGSAASKSDVKRLMTSLESVLNAMNRLSDRVDALSAKVEQLSGGNSQPTADGNPPTPSAGQVATPGEASSTTASSEPKEGEWDGEVDEGAWFDEDDDGSELADWRDVRRLKKLLEQTAPAPDTLDKEGDATDEPVPDEDQE